MKSKYIILFTVSLLLSACSDFLEVTPKGELIPETLGDYELILNGANLTDLTHLATEYASDDMYRAVGNDDATSNSNLYFWRFNIDVDATSTAPPVIWYDGYRHIYYSNVIIKNVYNAIDGTTTQKDAIYSEAATVRAVEYFNLLTVFANAYNPKINPQDLGIPLVVATDVTVPVPPRSSLQESFEIIINDLKNAVEKLPETQSYPWRVNKYGAAGMLARVYLYIQDYEKANQYATLALSSPSPNKILNYLNLTSATFPSASENSEKIWMDNTLLANEYYSQDLLELYDLVNDKRITMFTSTNKAGFVNRPTNRRNTGVSYPEMYLIQAEFSARSGTIGKAMEIVNMIRAKRLPATADNLVLEAQTPEEALRIVLEERRRELAYTGLRWYDMKRLDMDGRMPTVKRYADNDRDGSVLGTLESSSPNYTFEIPLKILALNPGIKTNH